jgi:hypothetical protein
MEGSYRPMLLKKSACPNGSSIDDYKHVFCTPLLEINVRKHLLRITISISCTYFSILGTELDFFNRIGRELPVMDGSFQTELGIRRQNFCKPATIYRQYMQWRTLLYLPTLCV